MKLCIIQCYPYLSPARSRNFAWHLLWLSTTEGKNNVKILAISQTRQFQLLSTDLPSNFWKIARLLDKIKKNPVSLRFISLCFPSKKWYSWRICRYWQSPMNSQYNEKGQWSGENTFTPSAARTIIFHRENLNYLIVCFTLCISFFFNTFVFYSRFSLTRESRNKKGNF